MNTDVVLMGVGALLVALAFLPWFRSTRAPMILGGVFVGLIGFALFGAAAFFAWLAERFAFQVFVIRHWGEIPSDAKTKILLLWGGQVAAFGLIAWLAYKFVWRSIARDLVRVDEFGQFTPYGRVYSVREQLGEAVEGEEPPVVGWVVLWRYNGKWTAPWRMERLVTTTEPEEWGVFRIVVPASRFEQTAPAEWRAVPLGDGSWIPTTPVLEQDFVAWEDMDLERKETIAKKGAQGHLFTQREKILKNNMDLTFLRAGRIAPKRAKEQVVPRRLRPSSEVDKVLRALPPDEPVQVEVQQGSNGNGNHGEDEA